MPFLFGETSTGVFNLAGGDTVYARQFSSSSSATVNEIQIYSIVDGNCKVALYDDSGGSPNSLLTANNTSTACSAGQWNSVSVTSASVSSGSNYWIVATGDTPGVCSQVSGSGGTTEFTSDPYSTWTAPSTWSGTGTGTQDCCFAAYGSQGDLGGGTYSYSGGTISESIDYSPELDSISDSTITDGQTGITITGDNFLTSGATLELCNNPMYSASTVQVSQSITAQSNTSITFTCDHNDQLFGYKWLFVTASNGKRNPLGFAVNVGRSVYAFVTNNSGSRSDGYPIAMFWDAPIGDTLDGSILIGGNTHALTQFTARATIDLKFLSIYSDIPSYLGEVGRANIHVYSDDSDYPDTLLASTGNTDICSCRNDLSVSTTPIVKGSKYWLGVTMKLGGEGRWNTNTVTSGLALYNASINFDTFTLPTTFPSSGYIDYFRVLSIHGI